MAQYFSTLLNQLIDWTDEEISLGKKFLDWNEVPLHWEKINLHWEDIFIILELKKRGGSSAAPVHRGELDRLYVEGNPWRKLRDDLGEEKAEKLIKVICKINNIEYSSILENSQSLRIIVNDFIRVKEDDSISVKIKL